MVTSGMLFSLDIHVHVLLILRRNWHLIHVKMPHSKISILRPQLQNGYMYRYAYSPYICIFGDGLYM